MTTADFFKAHFFESLFALMMWNNVFAGLLRTFVGEFLLVQPMVVASTLIEAIVLMGSTSFIDFLQSFVVALLAKVSIRVYLNPFIQTMSEYVTYGLELYKKHEEMASRQDDEEEGEDDDIGDSMYQEVEFESLSPAENIMMMLASYSAELVALLVYPFVILFIWWAEDIGLSLGALYDVRTTDFL